MWGGVVRVRGDKWGMRSLVRELVETDLAIAGGGRRVHPRAGAGGPSGDWKLDREISDQNPDELTRVHWRVRERRFA